MAEPLVGHNVSFGAVARGSDRLLLAFASHGASVDLGGVREVLGQMQRMEAGKHYNFASGSLTWHLMSDERNLIFVAITAYSYPLRHASALLQEIRGAVSPKVSDRASARLSEGALNADLKSILQKLCERFDDLKTVDQVTKIAIDTFLGKRIRTEDTGRVGAFN